MLKFAKLYFLTASLLIGAVSLLQAQEVPQQLINTIAKESCDCMENTDMGSDQEAAAEAMQSCMQEAVLNHISELMEHGLTDPDKAQQLGEEVALVLLKTCPSMTKMMQGSTSTQTRVKTQTSATKATLVEGTLKKIDKGPLTFLVLESAGQTERYLWFNDFEGSVDLIKMGNKAVGKTVKIAWQVRRYYDAQKNAYVSTREIKSFELSGN